MIGVHSPAYARWKMARANRVTYLIGRAFRRPIEPLWRLAKSFDRASAMLKEFNEAYRLHRFDTPWGPMIGGVVLLGILILAGLPVVGVIL